MDRYIVKEPRSGTSAGYPPGHQVITFSEPQPSMVPEAIYYRERYGSEFPNMQQQQIGINMNQGFMRVVHANKFPQQGMPPQTPGSLSGIDPNYLSAYSSNNAAYIASNDGPQVIMSSSFGNTYENRNHNNMGADRNKPNFNINAAFAGQQNDEITQLVKMGHSFGDCYENRNQMGADRSKPSFNLNATLSGLQNDARSREVKNSPIQSVGNKFNNENYNRKGNVKTLAQHRVTNALAPKVVKIEETKVNEEIKVLSRADKLKALHKSGPRAFSGPVEKVLKWHKALQEIGLLVIYEIVAKCVSVRPGDSCAKHLVIRDEGGPAMQVVYYEIDFLLPELKAGCTVRIVGKMMAGTSRFQAFNVRPASGDDVATLPRRAAVATHHVAKLCKEYGINF